MSTNNNNNNNANTQEHSLPEGQARNQSGSRPIFTLTMDPNALEQEIDQASQALQSTFNSLFNSMHSSVFGGLDSLHKEMSAFERSSREYIEPFYHNHIQHFPWAFRNDGSRRRYRITIEEIPPLEEDKPSKVFSTSDGNSSGIDDDGEFTVTHGKAGTPDEGKTVITTSASPGLLDWLLFTTHDDSFFRNLGNSITESATTRIDNESEPKVIEITKDEPSNEEQEAAKKRLIPTQVVPAIVEKVKKVGTSWEKDARQWWQGMRNTDQNDQSLSDGQDNSGNWPRFHSWGHSEQLTLIDTQSFSQTTITRPDGTVEHRSVKNNNGETETVTKIKHPDGSVEETITRENNGNRGINGRWRSLRQNEEDRERGQISAIVQEAFAEEQKESEKSRK